MTTLDTKRVILRELDWSESLSVWLVKAGVHPKVVQAVMRHASICAHYGHLFEGQEADAVQELSHLLVTEVPEILQATGTDD